MLILRSLEGARLAVYPFVFKRNHQTVTLDLPAFIWNECLMLISPLASELSRFVTSDLTRSLMLE